MDFSCDRCDYKTNRTSNLKRHKMSHEKKDAKKELIFCKSCDKQFKKPSLYLQHQKKHEGRSETYKFWCQICRKSIRGAYERRSHIRTVRHKKNLPSSCVGDCGKINVKASLDLVVAKKTTVYFDPMISKYKCSMIGKEMVEFDDDDPNEVLDDDSIDEPNYTSRRNFGKDLLEVIAERKTFGKWTMITSEKTMIEEINKKKQNIDLLFDWLTELEDEIAEFKSKNADSDSDDDSLDAN